MKIVIVGPGALGSLFAAFLGRAGHEPWLLDHDAKRAALLAARGIWLEANGREHLVPVRAAAVPALVAEARLILLCVKSAAVPATLAAIKPFFPADFLLIAFQNGISHFTPLQAVVPPDHLAIGIASLGATLLAPGRVRHGGQGDLKIGFLQPTPQAAQAGGRAAEILNDAVAPAALVTDILTPVWCKLLVNVGINALTALHECPNGHLLEDPLLLARLEKAVREAAAVARAKGLAVPEDPLPAVLEVCRATGANISSMLQDVRNRRRTEIDAINGAVVKEAHQLGMAVPANEELVRLVKGKEHGYSHCFC